MAAAPVCCSGHWTLFAVVKEVSRDSDEKLHGEKHKSKCFFFSIISPIVFHYDSKHSQPFVLLVFPQALLGLIDYTHTQQG